jgi:probable phosphomutase (TIGR03848 family)
MAILLLIRHGENDYVGRRLVGRTPGVHLNEAGRKHAQELAEALCHAPIKGLYSSPLERAVETAEPLAQALNLPVNLRPGLMEIDFGDWVGKTIGQMRRMKLWKVVQETPSQMRFPGGESFPEAQQRITNDLDEILSAYEDHDLVACFSHSDSIKLAIAHYLGLPLDNFQRLSVGTCSISILSIPKEGHPMVISLNQALKLDFQPPKPKKKNSKRS